MHIAGKIFLVLGTLITLVGVVMTIGGGSSLNDVGDWEVDEKSSFSGNAGTTDYYFEDRDEMMIMVSDDVRCDEFIITMTNETGENHITVNCEDDGEKPIGWEDDPDGWYHMASISAWSYEKGDYTIESNENYELVGLWEVIGDEIGDAAGGFLAAVGGVGTACCGVFFLILGGVFALVLKEPKKTQITGAGSFTVE
tara:strand:- start:2642 stop:3232 length:591 start_codon:yes stop_codon:yes gene_type:complete